jgi:branched-chain amino acid transport system substrate-binding protein
MKAASLVPLFIAVLLLASACVPIPPVPVPSRGFPAATAEPVKLGVIYNLTGAQAPLGVPSANGARLAAKEINASGGVLGRPVELILIDSKTDLAAVAGAATQLAESDKVAAMLGLSDSDQALAAAPIAAGAGIPFVTSGATSPRLPDQVPDYLFLACFGDNVQAAAGAEYAYDTLKAKTAYLLIDKDMEYTRLLGKYFKERFTELGGKVVLEDTYQTGDKEFSAQIARLKAAGALPDLLFIASGPDDIGEIVKQFRSAGLEGPILGGDAFDTPMLIQTAGRAAEKVYFTTHALLDPNSGSDAAKKFASTYRALYGAPPENAFAGLGYDTVNLIVDAIRRAGSADPQAIRAALAQTKDLPGVTGAITYQPGSRIPQKDVAVIEVKDGKFTLAGEVLPEKVPAP